MGWWGRGRVKGSPMSSLKIIEHFGIIFSKKEYLWQEILRVGGGGGHVPQCLTGGDSTV